MAMGGQTRAPGGSKLGVTTKAMILTCQSYHMSPAIHPQSTPPTRAWQRKRDDKARCPVRPDTRGYYYAVLSVFFFLTYMDTIPVACTVHDEPPPTSLCLARSVHQAGDYKYTLAAGHMA